MKRIMYIEAKGGGLDGPARIGWVDYSRSFRSMTYQGKRFLKCIGYKYNCIDEETGERYWISGPRKDGSDKLYGGVVEIDEDARLPYWMEIRRAPGSCHLTQFRS